MYRWPAAEFTAALAPKRPDAQAPELKLNQLPLPEELHELQVIMELAAPWMSGVFAQPAAPEQLPAHLPGNRGADGKPVGDDLRCG